MYVDLALLVLRVAVGVVIIGHGILKWGWLGGGGSLSGVAGWFNGLGFRPGMFWALVASLAEAVGGALTVLGLGRSAPASSRRTLSSSRSSPTCRRVSGRTRAAGSSRSRSRRGPSRSP